MRYFSDTDFANATPSCSIDQMDTMLLQMLDVAREKAGVPFIVNSAYRTVQHELENDRDGTSSHTKGVAVDIQAHGEDRMKILVALIEVGFRRIGVYSWGYHADIDNEKPNAVWKG